MRIAFYAPLKAPDHPVPSGDRLMARLLIHALSDAGHEVVIASRLRTWDAGSPTRQRRLQALGGQLAERFVRRVRRTATRPDCWFTYHAYHKSPDWIGPAVTGALGIPYVLAETSVAARQASGRWQLGHRQTLACLAQANALVTLNPIDAQAVTPHLQPTARHRMLKPFLDGTALAAAQHAAPPRNQLARRYGLAPARRWLIAVGMMRPGDKLHSYQLLAQALERLGGDNWTMILVGDGAARADVEQAFADLPQSCICFTGCLPMAAVTALLVASDLYLWPAYNEAYGMALLEAQACGLPVIAGASPGVASIVTNNLTGRLVTPADAGAFATAVHDLLHNTSHRRQFGQAAAARAREAHDITSATASLDALLGEISRPGAPPP